MNKKPVLRVVIAAAVYIVLYVLASSCGLIHPACYAYAGTVIPLLFAFVYLAAASAMRCFGAALTLNGAVLIAGLIAGEADLPMIVVLAVLTAAAEIVRGANGYSTREGGRRSFLPFAFSFYAYASHWWTDTAGSLAEAAEEMPAGYAEKMEQVIRSVPLLIVMLVLTVPIAVIAMLLAEKVLKKQAAELK